MHTINRELKEINKDISIYEIEEQDSVLTDTELALLKIDNVNKEMIEFLTRDID